MVRPLRESLVDVRRKESWEEEDAGLQVQPQPHFQPGCAKDANTFIGL